MEQTDRQILKLLKEDSRLSAKTVATMLGLSEKETEERIEAMQNNGVIVKYTAIVDNELVENEDYVTALIEVKVTPQTTHGFDSIAREIMKCREVSSVYLMSGAYDLTVIVEGKNLKEVSGFVSSRLSVMEDVVSTATHFILKKYKTEGVVLDKGDDRKRRELV